MKLAPFLVDPADSPAKRAIVGAALRLFTERGLSATSIRDIAEEAGFTNPALYRHFESKDALAAHLFEACYRWIATRTSAALRAVPAGDDKLRAYVGVAVDLSSESPEAVLFVNDHLRELWPGSRTKLIGLSLVTQTRALVREVRGGRPHPISDDLATATLLGALGQWSRELYFHALEGPPSRWREELVHVATRIVL
ncbi:Transcriptional regulator, TetR family protein [Minicystis rosea]|nr:Transcriptional regulator, TetR family protein [Minicystis rosea]